MGEIDRLSFGMCPSLKTIEFRGTLKEWSRVFRRSDWEKNVYDDERFPDRDDPANYLDATCGYTVFCADGTVSDNGKIARSPQKGAKKPR